MKELAGTGSDQHSSVVSWLDEKHFVVDGVRFFATITPSEYHSLKSTDEEFLIVKTRAMIEREIDGVDRARVRRILDIGIWQGGSVALYDRVFRPEKLVAVEYNPKPVEALARYVSRFGRREVRPYYGINQGNAAAMREILEKEFGDRSEIDLVVDDASHFYAETRTAFNVVFPFVAPNGRYVVEDWAWSHSQNWKLDYFQNKPAVTNLVLELCVLAATRPDMISEVSVIGSMAIVTKGPAKIPLSGFDIGNWTVNKGQPLTPTL